MNQKNDRYHKPVPTRLIEPGLDLTAAKKKKSLWIEEAIKKPGALRKTTKTKKGEKISRKALEKAGKSRSTKTQKRVALAKTLAKLRPKKKKKQKGK